MHTQGDFEGMVAFVKKAMNIEGRLIVAWVNSGGPPEMKDAPAWVSRPRKSAHSGKWSFCLTAGTIEPANQERR